MPERNSPAARPVLWAATGDVNAFFGLMLDNVADLLLMISLLTGAFAFPTEVAIRYMVPGTAIGVMVGDLLFFWLALQLAKKSGRSDVTAMPLGLDTPSTFGMVFFVLGPAFNAALKQTDLYPDAHAAAIHTWHIGICSIFISGLFKLACSVGSGWVRRLFPRAGLLGSLTAVALVLISFLPLLELLHLPLIGLVALAIILTTLIARVPLPFKIPGALGSLLIAGGLYYLMRWMESAQLLPPALALPAAHAEIDPQQALLPYEYFSAFRFEWISAMNDTLKYLPIVIPFALGTVVGGIDCTESAAAAGDDYDTSTVIGIEAVATLVASLFGGVIQTTPYIGHPAYKAMGGRAAYTLATALFVGSAGLIGYFGYLYVYIPKPTVFPILIFVGLEITAQSFYATPKRHYPAVALACVPALAALAMIYVDKLVPLGANIVGTPMEGEVGTLRILANGFIVTSLLWSSGLAALIDRKLFWGAAFFLVAALCTAFGIIHSPAPGSPLFVPWETGDITDKMQLFLGFYPSAHFQVVIPYVAGYLAVGILLIIWGGFDQLSHLQRRPKDEEDDDEENEEEEEEE
jgi:AGZA family xanthine/uracil permease-like MFS transporter